ncbi:MAG: cellulase N-terminal Ig-like domain-containing protein, partial [Candidatus Saccharimonadales bacterium]
MQRSAGVAGALAAGCLSAAEADAPVLVNHVGFTPDGAKFCLLKGRQSAPFTIVNIPSGTVAYRGTLTPRDGDLGQYLLGQFDELRVTGQ